MGRPKQTLPVRGKPMLETVLEVFRRTKVDRIVVVLGAHERDVRAKVRFQSEVVVSNPRHAGGMSSSLKVGLEAAGKGADAVIVALADQPLLSAATVDKLIKAYLQSKAPVVAPIYHGVRGNPVLLDRALFPSMMKVKGDIGARAVVEENRDSLFEVPVEDAGVLVDIDTPAEYMILGQGGKPVK